MTTKHYALDGFTTGFTSFASLLLKYAIEYGFSHETLNQRVQGSNPCTSTPKTGVSTLKTLIQTNIGEIKDYNTTDHYGRRY